MYHFAKSVCGNLNAILKDSNLITWCTFGIQLYKCQQREDHFRIRFFPQTGLLFKKKTFPLTETSKSGKGFQIFEMLNSVTSKEFLRKWRHFTFTIIITIFLLSCFGFLTLHNYFSHLEPINHRWVSKAEYSG